jgi:hypothetical protein
MMRRQKVRVLEVLLDVCAEVESDLPDDEGTEEAGCAPAPSARWLSDRLAADIA